jgi:small subunit ribosomal protein S9
MTTQPRYVPGTGKRKTAVAQVRLSPGEGTISINGKPLEQAFPRLVYQSTVRRPLEITETIARFSVSVEVDGGGLTGQAGAIAHGIARALAKMDENFHGALRKEGLLTRDARVKERKKYGLKRARRAPQYTKR